MKKKIVALNYGKGGAGAEPKDWEEQDTNTVARVYQKFLYRHAGARAALANAEAAEATWVSLVKDLYKELKDRDYDVEIVEFRGAKFSLSRVPTHLARDIKDQGAIQVAKNLTHGAVRVGGLIIDPCYRRLGSSYLGKDNYMLSEVKSKWTEIRNVSKIAELTSTDVAVAQRLLAAEFRSPQGAAEAGLRVASFSRGLRRNRVLLRARASKKVQVEL